MSTPQERLQNDVKEAMKAQDKERLGTLRMLLTEVKNEKIKLGQELGESEFIAAVRRLVKQRHDSATQYRDGGRAELAEKEEREITILETYLPQQASEDEIRAAIAELVAAQGLTGPKDIGKVMKPTLERFGARADGGTISRLARELLAGG